MKKIMTLAAIAAAALTLFSCNGVIQEPEIGNGVFVLTLDGGAMETKSADTSFETAVNHFDFFFFSDAEGTAPIAGMHGRAEGSSKTIDTQEGGEFAALRNVTSYVYVLANYPTELDHTRNWTLAELLALEVDSPIITGKKTEINPITGDAEETGEVTCADGLVMDSWQEATGAYTQELTPAKIQEQRTVTVGLTRLAAKITVEITVVPSVTIGGNVWKSHPELLTAYYVNALNNKATMLGTPVKRSALTSETGYDYFSYPVAYPMNPAPAEGVYTYTTDPVYTYPQEWTSDDNGEPYFKLQMPWINDNGDSALSLGSSNLYYKVTAPLPDASGKWKIERNKWYKVSLSLSMLNIVDDYGELSFDCTVIPWADTGWEGGSGLSSAHFFDVPTREFELYNESELAIPYSSSSAVIATIEEISYKYYGDSYGSTFEYVFRDDAFNKTEADGVTTITLKNTDSNGQTVATPGRELTTNTYTLSADGKFVNFGHPLDRVYTLRTIKLKITNQEGATPVDVVILQHPAIEVKKHVTKNAFVNGWFARAEAGVRDRDGNLLGVSYSPTTYGGLPNPAYHATTSWQSSMYVPAANTGLGTVYGSSSSSVYVNSIFTVEISISSFNGDDEYTVRYIEGNGHSSTDGTLVTKKYRIGDPRVPMSTRMPSGTLPNYLVSDKTHRTDDGSTVGTDKKEAWKEPLKILMASQNADAKEVIAPRFLVSSQFNVMQSTLNNSESARRAATYQEDGYPAGRWRLPTEAEIAFIVARQKDGTIPYLFAATHYHCADGRMFYVDMTAGHEHYAPISNTATAGYNRFIYDLWYWGDDPTEDALKYHPESEMTEWEKAISDDGVTPNWKAHWKDYYHPNMHAR